jgi:hypothetical protein
MIVVGLVVPSSGKLKAAEIDRCRLAAQAELGRRIATFNTAYEAKTTALASLRSLLVLQQ